MRADSSRLPPIPDRPTKQQQQNLFLRANLIFPDLPRHMLIARWAHLSALPISARQQTCEHPEEWSCVIRPAGRSMEGEE